MPSTGSRSSSPPRTFRPSTDGPTDTGGQGAAATQRTHARIGALVRIAALVALLLPASARAGSDPDQTWATIATAHFDIHYHDGGRDMALHAAAVAEEALAKLAPVLGWTPSERIQVVLRDESDGANGFASAANYDRLTLLASPPEADAELGNYDDWLHLLITHELTHILHLDNVSGVPGVFNDVFGKVLLPNQATPNWFIEGLATWAESAYTPAGRVGDAWFEMYIRTSVLAGDPLDLSEMTAPPARLPRATSWYAYGGAFLTFIVREKGTDALREMLRLYGRRLIPYGLNSVAREAFGESLVDLYARWMAELRVRYAAFERDRRALGLMEGEQVTTSGEFNGNIGFRPGTNELAYVISDGKSRSHMVLRDLDTGEETTILTCYGGCGRPTFSPDGQTLYYSRSDITKTYYRFRELARLDLATGHVERVTHGRRLRDPDLAPDGRTLAFVTTQWGRTELRTMDLQTGDERLLLGSEGDRQPSMPRWSPDGSGLVLSMQVDGVRDLWWLDPGTGALRRLTRDVPRDVNPSFTPDGSHVLYASSAEGVWDLFALRLSDGRRLRVTRVLTGALQPEVDPAGRSLWFRRWSTEGWDLARMDYDPSRWEPQDDAPDDAALAARSYVAPEPEVDEEEPYDPSWTLWPRSWFPDITFLSGDAITLGLKLGGSDAVGHHAWVLSSQWTVDDARPVVVAAYSNDRFLPSIGVSGAWFRHDNLAFDGRGYVLYEEEILLGSLSLGVPFPGLDESFAMSIRFDVQHARPTETPAARAEPDYVRARLPDGRTSLGITTAWAYDNTESYSWSVTSELGRRLSMSFYLNPPLADGDAMSYALRWSWTEYLPALWLDHHVWALRLQGGVSGGGGRQTFRVGGIPERDLVDDILNQRGIGGAQLRGFAPGALAGDQFHLANGEYIFPIAYVHRGLGTLPIYLGRVYGLVFADVGTATRGALLDAEWSAGVGAELRATFDLLYGAGLTLRLGFAQGVTDGGETQVYFVSGGGF